MAPSVPSNTVIPSAFTSMTTVVVIVVVFTVIKFVNVILISVYRYYYR